MSSLCTIAEGIDTDNLGDTKKCACDKGDHVLRGDSFALAYVGESTRYGIVEDVLDHEVSEYVNENKKF